MAGGADAEAAAVEGDGMEEEEAEVAEEVAEEGRRGTGLTGVGRMAPLPQRLLGGAVGTSNQPSLRPQPLHPLLAHLITPRTSQTWRRTEPSALSPAVSASLGLQPPPSFPHSPPLDHRHQPRGSSHMRPARPGHSREGSHRS